MTGQDPREAALADVVDRMRAVRRDILDQARDPSRPESWRLSTAAETLAAALDVTADVRAPFGRRCLAMEAAIRSIFQGWSDASEEFVSAQDSVSAQSLIDALRAVERLTRA